MNDRTDIPSTEPAAQKRNSLKAFALARITICTRDATAMLIATPANASRTGEGEACPAMPSR